MSLRKNVFRALLATLALGSALALAGCGSSQSTSAGGSPSGSANASSTQGAVTVPANTDLKGNEIAVIKTNKGTIKVKFFEKDAPITVGNFVKLSEQGFYNGIKFHRYVPGFVIQGGDPQTVNAAASDVAGADAAGAGKYGTGGPGYTIQDEYANNPNRHVDGSIAMARTSAPNSGGSQFYFALGPLPSLDGKYTVFGQTISGLDVVHKLRAGDTIQSITIETAQ